jgi:hypothetical protein
MDSGSPNDPRAKHVRARRIGRRRGTWGIALWPQAGKAGRLNDQEFLETIVGFNIAKPRAAQGGSSRGFPAIGTIVAVFCILLFTYKKWQAAGEEAKNTFRGQIATDCVTSLFRRGIRPCEKKPIRRLPRKRARHLEKNAENRRKLAGFARIATEAHSISHKGHKEHKE